MIDLGEVEGLQDRAWCPLVASVPGANADRLVCGEKFVGDSGLDTTVKTPPRWRLFLPESERRIVAR